jgi:hypothetical protein
MIPTLRLRFVERTFTTPRDGFFGGGVVEHKYHVLQQYHVPLSSRIADKEREGEWIDVPLVTEDGP